MPDLTITTEQLTRLAPVAAAVQPMAFPTATARYVVIRFSEKVEAAIKPFAEAESGMMTKYAMPGSIKQNGAGRVTFDIAAEAQAAYTAERATLLAEPVTLTGVRALTRTELGECPITVQQDRVLVECGLLEPIPDISP